MKANLTLVRKRYEEKGSKVIETHAEDFKAQNLNVPCPLTLEDLRELDLNELHRLVQSCQWKAVPEESELLDPFKSPWFPYLPRLKTFIENASRVSDEIDAQFRNTSEK